MTEAFEFEQGFTTRGLPGAVRIRMWANPDPVATGHDLIATKFDRRAFTGFPIVVAEVDYPQDGPRGVFYWVQTVTQTLDDGSRHAQVDSAHGPFYCFGHKPTLMDAPATPDHPDMDWIARAYLLQAPHVIAVSRLEAVTGFVWGYRIESGRPVTLYRPQMATPDDWTQVRSAYQDAFPDLDLRP